MRKFWKTLAYGLSMIGFAGGLAACTDFIDDGDNVYPAAAQVSFYHASPNTPQLTVTVEEKNLLNAPLGYAQFSGYLNFYVGSRQFKFKNGSSILADTTLLLKQNYSYSVFVINEDATIETVVTIDTAEAPSTGKAMVRFMQLSPDIAPIDVSVEGENADRFSALAYKQGSVFKEMNAGTFKFIMKNATSDDEIFKTNNITLEAGRYYTIISRGYKTPPQGNTNTLNVQIVAND